MPRADALSPVVASDNVFHVLLFLEVAPMSVTPLEQVKSEVFARELRQRCEVRYDSLVRELQAQMKPEFDDQALARLAASVAQ